MRRWAARSFERAVNDAPGCSVSPARPELSLMDAEIVKSFARVGWMKKRPFRFRYGRYFTCLLINFFSRVRMAASMAALLCQYLFVGVWVVYYRGGLPGLIYRLRWRFRFHPCAHNGAGAAVVRFILLGDHRGLLNTRVARAACFVGEEIQRGLLPPIYNHYTNGYVIDMISSFFPTFDDHRLAVSLRGWWLLPDMPVLRAL